MLPGEKGAQIHAGRARPADGVRHPSGHCGLSKAGRLSGAALSDKAVARLVKHAAAAAGLDAERYSGHSLRAGLATAAGDQGAGLADLMRQTRRKSTEVALGYLRPDDLWRNNVTEGVLARGRGRPPSEPGSAIVDSSAASVLRNKSTRPRHFGATLCGVAPITYHACVDTVTLPPELERFATEAIAAGRYRDIVEVLTAGVARPQAVRVRSARHLAGRR